MKTLMQNLLKLQTLEFGGSSGKDAAPVIGELRGKIPAPILGHYDRLRVRCKKGLAAVRNQVCTGCHMTVPIGIIMTLKHNTDIQLCETCGRYLYLVDEPKTEPVAEPAKTKTARAPGKRKQG
jgi:hypothetical protein